MASPVAPLSDILEKPTLQDIADAMKATVEIKNRKYHFKTYESCFLGTDAVRWLMSSGNVTTVDDAVAVGNEMMQENLIYHVTKDSKFCNAENFFRFTADDDHGRVGTTDDGQNISWAQSFLPKSITDNASSARNADYYKSDSDKMTSKLLQDIEVSPMDEHNIKLLDNVHPASWKNPTAKDDAYTLVVLGAGAGGLVTAAGAAGVGARVALIERHLMGGDCLNIGCVPSKAMIRAARAVKDSRDAKEFGIEFTSDPVINFGAAMERLRRIRAEISTNDSCTRFSKELGVEVFQGSGEFTSPNSICVNGVQHLKFKKAVIATGGSAAIPQIPGLSASPFLTNASIFNLTSLPPRVCVIGAGPIGLELAQAMARFGSKVSVFVRGDQLLPKEDRDAAAVVEKSLLQDGIEILYKTSYTQVNYTDDQGKQKYCSPFNLIEVVVNVNGAETKRECEVLLVATGRFPNVEGIGLEKANVKYDTKKGVKITDTMQTTNKNIYAVGDCCTKFQFTHVADFMARGVIRNALFFGKVKHSSLLVPWATYTEPEVAHVGYYEADMKRRNIEFDSYVKHFSDVDRAICDGELEGFVKIHCKKGGDEILGATIVNANAGNMISEITLAMQHRIGLGSLAAVIHPYPTQSEAIRQCGDLYNKTRLTPMVKGLLSRLANRSLT